MSPNDRWITPVPSSLEQPCGARRLSLGQPTGKRLCSAVGCIQKSTKSTRVSNYTLALLIRGRCLAGGRDRLISERTGLGRTGCKDE